MCGLACAKGQGCVASACVCNAVSCASGCCAGEACLSPGVTSCGTAGAACVECSKALQNAVNATCTATGTCDYGACLAGYADLDGNRANGCESTLPTGVPEAPSLVLWLAADTGWNGQAWLDQSGGGRDALPYVGAPGTGTLNGKSVVDFNGGSLLIPAGFPAWSGLTIFALANTSADDGLLTMGVSYNGSCDPSPPLGAAGCMPYDMLSFGAAMGLQQCDPQIGSCYQVYAPPIPLGAWVRSTAEEDPAANPSFRSFFNSVDNGAGSNHNLPYPYPPPWAAPRKDTIVGWRNYRGLVAEIIAFDAPLSDVSRKAVDAYLAAKWKVP